MRLGGNSSAWLLAGCVTAVAVTAWAVNTQDSPYDSIVVRNAFALKPPPPPAPPVDESAKEAPKITLTGMTTILGLKQVVLKAEIPARQGEKAKEESYLLGVGERAGDIEVLDIDDKAGSVKLNVRGLEGPVTLDFQHNGPKPPSNAGGAGAPGAMASAISGFGAGGQPNYTVGTSPTPLAYPPPTGVSSAPPASNLPGQNPGGFNPTAMAAAAAPGGGEQAGVQFNFNGVNTPQPIDPNQPAVAQYHPGVSPDEQAILIEAQRARMIEDGDPVAKLMPLTQFSDEASQGTTPKGY